MVYFCNKMNNIHLKTLFLISILYKNVSCDISVNEHKDFLDRRKENYKNSVVTLTADCFKNGSIFLTLYTNEPFTGSIYSRSAPSSCKTLGDGKSKRTKLFLNDTNQCGVQFSPTTYGIRNPRVITKYKHFTSNMILLDFILYFIFVKLQISCQHETVIFTFSGKRCKTQYIIFNERSYCLRAVR